MHGSNEMNFGWCFIIYLVFWKTCASLDIFWSWMWSGTWTFFCEYSIGIRTWQWCEWMRCHVERGYGNLTPCGSTLWVRVKRHVIHHDCIVDAQKIRGRLLQEFIASWKIGREHSTYCGRNLVCDQPVSQYSIGLRTYHFWHQDDVIDQCWPVIVVYWSVLHLILDSTWVWYSLLLELKIPTLVWHWDYFLCREHWEVYSLQVMRTQLETLGEEFKLAGNTWWRENLLYFELGPWDALALWRQWPHLGILFVWEFCDEMFRCCEDNTYIIVIVTYGIIHLILWCAFYRSWDDFGYLLWRGGREGHIVWRRLWSTLWIGYYSGRKTSAIQLYIWLTYIDNVEQNILFYFEVGSCEMLSLCGRLIWRRNFVFWLCFVFRRRLYRYLVWITSFLRS